MLEVLVSAAEATLRAMVAFAIIMVVVPGAVALLVLVPVGLITGVVWVVAAWRRVFRAQER